MNFAASLLDAIRQRISIDTRALAAFRISLGAILLIDIGWRATDLVAFYTDAGVVPRETLSALAPTFRLVSLHALWSSGVAQAVLFAIAGVFALCLLFGYRTRVATFGSLILLVSLHARNPAVLIGGDSLLRHLLLWGLLLPLGERWSVDAVGRDSPRERVASVASAGLFLQVVAVYATNVLVKFRGDLWLDGSAVEQVMLLTRFSTSLGQALLEVPIVLTAATYLWVGLLVCSPFLVVLTGYRRLALLSLFGVMHAGMFLFMELGIFPLVSLAALVPFVPPSVWDRLPAPQSDIFERLDALRPSLDIPLAASPIRQWPRSITQGVAAILLCLMILVNAASVGVLAYPDATPAAIQNKGWDMFAPNPPADDGWYVVPATLESGRQIDALRREPLSWDRPPDVSATFANNRWQKLLYQIRGGPEERLQEPLATYLCQRWNRGHDVDMERLRLVYIPYSTKTETRGGRVELGRFECPS